MSDDGRNWSKLIGYLILIGFSAITLNWLYQHLIEEWNRSKAENTDKSQSGTAEVK